MSIFGTDGVRGRAGEGPLAAPSVLRLAQAFARVLQEQDGGAVVLARDTRRSGPMLRGAVVAGLCSCGVEVVDLGVLPTPALAWYLAEHAEAAGGVMITASHNSWPDNGIKLFAAGGGKFADEQQDRCEALFGDSAELGGLVVGGCTDAHATARQGYLASLAADFAGVSVLAGKRILADAAAGAASGVLAPALLAAGAEVHQVDPKPNGQNINQGCGALHGDSLAQRVIEDGAWAGLAVDGDGDRILLVDEEGSIHDGDAIVGFLAERMLAQGSLRGGGVVGTVTTGCGLEQFLGGLGLGLTRTQVGDRHVARAMAEQGCNLGGESSGHVLTPDLCPSGDGIRVGLAVLAAAASKGLPLSEQLGAVPRFPVENRKVPVVSKPPLEGLLALVEAQGQALEALSQSNGRILLRYSGTEPVLRVRVEAEDRKAAEVWADRLAHVASEAIAAT